MKFSVSKSALMNAMNIVVKGMGANSTLPVLSGVYIKAFDGTLELQTTDLTVAVRHRCAAFVEEEGETVVSGKLLSEIVKTLNDAAVNFESEGHEIKLTCENSTFNLKTLDPSEFPEFPQVSPTQQVELPREILSEMVNKVYRCASKDVTRRALTGVKLTAGENTLQLSATDSYRIAICDTHVETSTLDEKFELVLLASTIHSVLTIPSESNDVMIGKTDTQAVFIMDNTTYITRRLDVKFPNCNAVFPQTCSTTVTLDKDEFTAAVRRMSIIGRGNHSVRLHVIASEGVVKLTSESDDLGLSSETINAKVEGSDVSISLIILDCLTVQGENKEITLEMNQEVHPVIFKSYSSINFKYLLMPQKP